MSKMYKGYLEVCMPSELMRSYLNGIELEPWQKENLVKYAPVPIEEKLAEFRKLRDEAEIMADSEAAKSLNESIKSIEIALMHLESIGIFSVEVVEYNEDAWPGTDSDFRTICSSYEGVKRFIKEDLEISEIEPDDLHYYEVRKWEMDGTGEYAEICTYIIPRDEIIYFQLESNHDEIEHRSFDSYCLAADLNVPVPFKPGDILEFGSFPFGPKFHALILSIGDNWDCCCVQGLALNYDGLWSIGAVKHGMLGPDYFPKYSYLYNARYDSKLHEKEKFLQRVHDFIGGDEKRAEALYMRLWPKGFTEEEVTEILEELESADD